MALNKQTLQTRAGSAAIFVVVMLGLWLWNQWTFSLSLVFIVGMLMYEWTQLCIKIKKRQDSSISIVMGVIAALFFGFLVYFFLVIAPGTTVTYMQTPADAMFTLMLYFSLIFATLLLVVTLISPDLPRLFFGSQLIIGFIFFVSTYALLIPLYPWWIPLMILFSIWINDTSAYLFGSLYGKTPLAPKVSPNKTWEGTLSGIGMTVLIAWAVSFVFKGADQYAFSTSELIFVALISAVTGTIGDLIESAVKRMAGVKDSGNLMPGHGGIYDRFDAFSFAIPWVCLYLKYFYG